jgi:hypothetical protein
MLQFVPLIFRALPESSGSSMRHDCDMRGHFFIHLALNFQCLTQDATDRLWAGGQVLLLPPKLIRTYDRNTYTAEKRDALERWANHLAVAVAQATGANVTALRKA